MDLIWYVCDLVTGQILDELPLAGADKVRRRIALVDSATFTLPVHDPKCPADWTTNLVPGKTMLVLTVNGQPVNAWAIIDYSTGSDTVPINVSTLEECLSRTNVPDYDPPLDADLSDVAVALAQPLVTGFGFVTAATASGKVYNGNGYNADEDRSILAALNEDIMGADGGPEWRIIVRWTNDDHGGFTKILQVAPRVGQDRPDARFDLDAAGRGSIESYTRTVSYAAGKGATQLTGTSDGSGSSRPMTDPQTSTLIAAGWPMWQERKNFTGLDDATDLDTELLNRTKATLKAHERGTTTWAVTGHLLPGVDYNEGDTVYIDVAPQGRVDPIGGTATTRVLGWELDPAFEVSTPILWDSEEDGSG